MGQRTTVSLLWAVLFCFVSLGAQNVETYVTVYNKDLGLIRQVREVHLDPASPRLEITDVAEHLIPTSVILKPLEQKAGFRILEQNFEYDLASASKILHKYVDRKISLFTADGQRIEGKLLSSATGTLVLQTEREIMLIPYSDDLQITVEELPEGLITRPTLIWLYESQQKQKLPLELTYLTSGMQWQAEYVGVLNEQETEMETSAWVSIENNSGATYHNAHIKLVAGEIHRARPPAVVPYQREFAKVREAAPFEEKALFEYHLYTLQRTSTLKNNQIKQISLFPMSRVRTEKKFVYNSHVDNDRVLVQIEFLNDPKYGLGMPLPAGTFRLYKRDGASVEFIGEDRISHTPRQERVSITAGKAFDLLAERRIMEQRRLSKTSEEQVVEIEFRNRKSEKVEILVKEFFPVNRNWEIKESTFPYQKKTANQVEFTVPVEAEQSSTLRYRVLYWW